MSVGRGEQGVNEGFNIIENGAHLQRPPVELFVVDVVFRLVDRFFIC